MFTYAEEKISDNLKELDEITKLHHDEVGTYKDIPVNVDWAKYLKLEELGVVKLYVMRKKNVFIGYAVFSVLYSIDYKNSLQGSMMNIFIHPSNRGRGTKFISYCDEQMKDLGVQVVHHHVKVKNNYGVLLKRLGYETVNISYSKRLD